MSTDADGAKPAPSYDAELIRPRASELRQNLARRFSVNHPIGSSIFLVQSESGAGEICA